MILVLLLFRVAPAVADDQQAAPPLDKAAVDQLVQTIEDPAQRDKLVTQLKLLTSVQPAKPADSTILPEVGDVGEQLSAGALLLADWHRKVSAVSQHLTSPKWRAQAMATLIRETGWTALILLVGWGARVALDRLLKRRKWMKRLARVGLLLFVLSILFYVWGLEVLARGSAQLWERFSGVSLAALLAFAVWIGVNAAIERYLLRAESGGGPSVARSARVQTLLPILRSALMGTLVVLVVIVALGSVGINIAPILAGAGVIGVAVGFGSQKLVHDVITGVFILFENSMAIGEVVKIGDYAGMVEAMTIRTVKLRDDKGQLHSIPFGNITMITNQSRNFGFHVFEVGVSLGADLELALATVKALTEELVADPEVGPHIIGPVDLNGVERISATGAFITGRFKTPPLQQLPVARAFNMRLVRRFAERGIAFALPAQTVLVQSVQLAATDHGLE
jgi:small-conductance mechanosensitive channel